MEIFGVYLDTKSVCAVGGIYRIRNKFAFDVVFDVLRQVVTCGDHAELVDERAKLVEAVKKVKLVEDVKKAAPKKAPKKGK